RHGRQGDRQALRQPEMTPGAGLERLAGPAETFRRPGRASGSSTSRPGRGRALGRARPRAILPGAGPRPAWSARAAPGSIARGRISEPETALRVMAGDRTAGAALRRPGCEASG